MRTDRDPLARRALRDVSLRPSTFFSSLPRTGPLARAALFASVCIVVSTLLAYWLAGESDNGLVGGLVGPLVFDVVLFAAYVALTHALVALLVRGRSRGVRATFKIVAYGQVTQLVNWLPDVGLVAGFVWGSVLTVVGVRAMHGAGLRTAVAVVLVPVALAAAIAGVVVLIVG